MISSINSPDVEILASLNHNNDDVDTSTVVAVKQGHIIATAFHPELTHDDRIHKYFIAMSQDFYKNSQSSSSPIIGKKE